LADGLSSAAFAFRCDNKVKEATDAINKTIEIYKSHPKARMVLEELEGEGPPKVDQTTVGQAYALIPNAGEAGRPRGRGKGSKGERVKALRTSAGAG
jgi:hypothetical protein